MVEAVGELPDPARTRVLLVGTSRFTSLDDLPAVAGNLKLLSELFTQMWQLPPGHCTTVSNPASPRELSRAVRGAADEASETLLIYYSGHGLIESRTGQLHLAVEDSDSKSVHDSAVPYEWIRRDVENSPAARRIVVLDCCFSARAFGVQAPAAALEVEGTYLLAAAAETAFALSPPDEPLTAFTGEWATVLREGVLGGPEFLDLDTIFSRLRTRLINRNRPEPQRLCRNQLGRTPFIHNSAYVPPTETRVGWDSGSLGTQPLRTDVAVAALYTGGRSLADTLQAVADGAVSGLGYELACVNVVQTDGDLVVAAFAGSPAAEALVTGRIGSRASWERRLTMGEDWDGLRFIPHTEGDVLLEDDVPQWYTQGPEPQHENDWHPLDRLYAPLYGPTSDLLGVISVDRPVGGIRPGESDRGALRTYAFHCAIAISNARLRANMQRALVRLEREQHALRTSEELFRQAFEYAPSGMAVADVGGDQHGRLLRTNDALCLMLGRPASAMRRLSFSDLVHPDDIGTLLRTSAEGGRAELRLARRDGSYVWVSLRNSVVADTTNGAQFLLTNIDSIEDRKHRDLALEVRARYDALTGLLSETELHDRLRGRLCNRADEEPDGPDFALVATLTSTSAGHKRPALRGSSVGLPYDHRHTEEPGKGEATLAVLHFGIDKFKKINSRFGLAAGNAVLIEISRRLRQEMPADCDIARLRGDEFVVLVDNVDEKGAEKVAGGVRDMLRRSIALSPSNDRARIEATSVLSWASCGTSADQILGQTSQLLHSKKQLG